MAAGVASIGKAELGVSNTGAPVISSSNALPSNASSSASLFVPKDEPVENFRRMRVVVIGAGYSGIYMGIRIPEWLRNVDLTIYEKNEGIGGTWWENRYPGCACDIPGMLCSAFFLSLLSWQTSGEAKP